MCAMQYLVRWAIVRGRPPEADTLELTLIRFCGAEALCIWCAAGVRLVCRLRKKTEIEQ